MSRCAHLTDLAGHLELPQIDNQMSWTDAIALVWLQHIILPSSLGQ